MDRRVAIAVIGSTPFRSITPDISFKEMMFEAAAKAYEDAGISPQEGLDAFVTCEEDFAQGRDRIWGKIKQSVLRLEVKDADFKKSLENQK